MRRSAVEPPAVSAIVALLIHGSWVSACGKYCVAPARIVAQAPPSRVQEQTTSSERRGTAGERGRPAPLARAGPHKWLGRSYPWGSSRPLLVHWLPPCPPPSRSACDHGQRRVPYR